MRLDASPEPVVHGPHLHIDTLQCAERPLDLRQALVGRDRRLRPEFIRWQTGSDEIKAIEPCFGCDLVLLAAEGEAAVGDLEREVFLHLILVDDFGGEVRFGTLSMTMPNKNHCSRPWARGLHGHECCGADLPGARAAWTFKQETVKSSA